MPHVLHPELLSHCCDQATILFFMTTLTFGNYLEGSWTEEMKSKVSPFLVQEGFDSKPQRIIKASKQDVVML